MRSVVGLVSSAAVCAGVLCASVAFGAGVPERIALQGVLHSSGGLPVSDGKYPMIFRIYDTASGGKALLSETQIAVPVTGGLYSVILGAIDGKDPVPASLFASKAELYFGVQVSDDPELPRAPLSSVPFAAQAAYADEAIHADTATLATTADGLSKPITGDLIAPGSLGASAVGFTYAGSSTKGGAAMDLACTGCVELGELAVGVLVAANVGYDGTKSGAPYTEAQSLLDALWGAYAQLTGALHVSGKTLGVGKAPAAGCGLDIEGVTCEGGVPVFHSKIFGSQAALEAEKTDGLYAYRTDVKKPFVRVGGVWREILVKPYCGDSLTEAPEECDDGAQNADAPDKCRITCKKPACGDSIADSAEQCDDGNGVNTDGCVSGCKKASCGDGFVYAGVEACDDGAQNANTADKCRTICLKPACGDGIKDTGEACDDGNIKDGDGCSSKCLSEILLSCADVLAGNPGAPSGVHSIQPNGYAAFSAYCNQTSDGGGWTLVMNVNTADGTMSTLNAALWTSMNEVGTFTKRWTNDYKSPAAVAVKGTSLLLVVRKAGDPEGATPVGWRSWNLSGNKAFQDFFTVSMGSHDANATGGCNGGAAGDGRKQTAGVKSTGIAAPYDTFTGFANEVYSNSYYGGCGTTQDGFRLSSWYRWANNSNVGLGLLMDSDPGGPYNLEAGSHMKIDTYGNPQRYCTAGCGGCTAYPDGSESGGTTKVPIGTDHNSNHCTVGVSYRYEWYVK